MKTDRELLEMAAKAAGYGEVWHINGSSTSYIGPKYEIGGPVAYKTFSPLTDDGDALRLAVRLKMTIGVTDKASYVDCDDERKIYVRQPMCASDREAMSDLEATRRAIVRAAAAIGESMP